MRVEDFTFEQRPLSALPTTSDLISWLADFGGDDQWVDGDEQAVVVLGDHIIVWKDGPLTDEDKRSAVAEYEDTLEADAARDEDGCYADNHDAEDAAYNWYEEGF